MIEGDRERLAAAEAIEGARAEILQIRATLDRAPHWRPTRGLTARCTEGLALIDEMGRRLRRKLVVALGDCGCTGGIFGESYASCGRVSNVIPVDVAVPGCPPTPLAIIQGILTAIKA